MAEPTRHRSVVHELECGDESDILDLSPCCACGAAKGMRIVTLHRRSPNPGHGWGCTVCGLPPDDAYAVPCDTCADRYAEAPAILTTACAGYPVEGRVAIADLSPGPFDHDLRFQLHELPPAGSG